MSYERQVHERQVRELAALLDSSKADSVRCGVKVHVARCLMLNAANSRRGLRCIDWDDVLDLHGRGYKIGFCKCTPKELRRLP